MGKYAYYLRDFDPVIWTKYNLFRKENTTSSIKNGKHRNISLTSCNFIFINFIFLEDWRVLVVIREKMGPSIFLLSAHRYVDFEIRDNTCHQFFYLNGGVQQQDCLSGRRKDRFAFTSSFLEENPFLNLSYIILLLNCIQPIESSTSIRIQILFQNTYIIYT